jgi:hypothetical protein
LILDACTAQADPDRLEFLNAVADRMSEAAAELAAVAARAESLVEEITTLGAQRRLTDQAVDAARTTLVTAENAPEQTAAQAALDAVQTQADAAGAARAEAEGDVATAEAPVLAADIPLALFASEIALAEAGVALMARQGAVEALKAATAVPALYLLRPGIHTVVPLRRDLI